MFFLLTTELIFINSFENLYGKKQNYCFHRKTYFLRYYLLFCFAMDRRKVFNKLVEYYGKRLPHQKGEQQVVANE